MHLSLAGILGEAARRTPDRIAVLERQAEFTYEELWEMSRSTAAALADLGVKADDRVALLAANTTDFVASYYAILALGAIVVPIPPMLVTEEIGVLLADSGAVLALVEKELAGPLAEAAAATDTKVKVLRDGSGDDLVSAAAAASPIAGVVTRSPLDPAVIFYTSGTTGVPKGAVLTHVNLVMNSLTNTFLLNDFQADDAFLGCLPLFHTFGQMVVLNSAFLRGARVVLQRRFDAKEAIELIRRHDIDVMIGVPTMFIALLEAFDPDDPVSLRYCVCGGAPMPVAVLEEFEQAFGCVMSEGYGLSETSPTASANQKEFGIEPGTIGHPIWGVEVEVAAADVDDRIELLEPNEEGEIVIRGHNIFAGYLNRPEATAAAMVDGWFRSGDIGTKDERGFLRVVGRKKDMIIRGGYNVYPREIEETLVRHPAVAQVAVIGINHPTHGEEVLAVVVPDGGGPEITEDLLLDWSAERVARHRRPRRVVFVDELPLGPSNKVLKRQLRDRYDDLIESESRASP